MLQSIGLHRVGHDLVTKQQQQAPLRRWDIQTFTFSRAREEGVAFREATKKKSAKLSINTYKPCVG